jgi:hypothetical protein
MGPVSVFILSHERDEGYRTALEDQLLALEYDGSIALWHEGRLTPGTDREAESMRHLQEANIILLLVTKNWLRLGDRLTSAMARQAAGARLIPVRVAPAVIDAAPFVRLEPLPQDSDPRPIALRPTEAEREEAWCNVARGLLPLLAAPAAEKRPVARPSGEAKLLFLSARPTGAAWLELEKEYGAIRESLHDSEGGRRVALVYPGPVPVEHLAREILRERPTMLHFSGHGDRSGRLLFASAEDQANPMDLEQLAGLFRILNEEARLRCVVLNACFSRAQGEAIRRHVDFVVGMATAIPDAAAIRFATSFYLALGHGRSVRTAFELGCAESGLTGPVDVGPVRDLTTQPGSSPVGPTPVLLCRPGVDAGAVRLVEAG